ncbi:Fc.00g047410.m01.CDS01 [Cosmosporella sp. VM-42]
MMGPSYAGSKSSPPGSTTTSTNPRTSSLSQDAQPNNTAGPLSSQPSSAASEPQHDSPARNNEPGPASTPNTSPQDEVVRSLVEQYFDCLYPLASFSFLHKATVIQRCRDKTIDKSLKLAICAITAMFFNKHNNERGAWAQESERLILDRLERPSIFQLQASLLVIRYRAGVGQFPRAFIMAGLAARWAVALRLNYEHSSLGPVAQEVRRRTFWSLYLLEDSFCVGLKEFELFDADTIHLQLPCEDDDFNEERPLSTGYLQPGKGLEPEVLGSRAAFVRLAFIRRCIMRLNRRIFLKEVNLSDLFCAMEKFQNDLLRLRSRLAPRDQYPPLNPEELHRPPQYAIMHMSWHQCHCDLYRIFLTGYPESTPHAAVEGMTAPERALMKDKCLGHAEQIVKVLSDFVQHKDERHMLEFDAAVCAYHGARLILFGTYTGRDNTGLPMQMAINKAQLCLDVITRYFDFSAQLKPMRRELERVIQQHKSWLESSDHRAVSAVDPTTDTPPKLSKDAYIRQRLAIHSLLRQSDFVDDSRDAAPEPPPAPAEPALSWTASTEDDQMQEAQNDWNPREPTYPPPADPMDPNILFGLPYGGAAMDFNAWTCNPGPEELCGYLEVFDEQYMY